MEKKVLKHGSLVVSLDFELAWGAWPGEERQKEYQARIKGAREVIPEILKLFREFEIHATWAIVGLLFFKTKESLLQSIPDVKPIYTNPKLSVYDNLEETIGEDENADPLHFAPSLIDQIRNCPFQEIASHTFSHYYCLEKGQTLDHLRADLSAFINVIKSCGLSLKSIVFPLNQANSDYLNACAEEGIETYRGNPKHCLYASAGTHHSLPYRLLRLADGYLNISGFHSYYPSEVKKGPIVNIPWSRFLRPYMPYLSFLEPLKRNRICREMTYAAEQAQIYHLWWHPYNFGIHQEQNLELLRFILTHYSKLHRHFGMRSVTMKECSDMIFGKSENGE